jgi:Kdo2-lipid IVA lauroyltransferase/acyltransferase
MLLLRVIRSLACVLSEAWVRRLGGWLGWFAFHVLRVRRAVAVSNLRLALGLDVPQARRLAARVYVHLATGAIELLRVSALRPERAAALLGEQGLARLRALLADGHGVLVLSAHLGHWDLLACASARCGIPVTVVTRSIKSSSLNRFWMDERSACGVRLLPAKGSARAVVNALRRSEAVAMLIDQHEPGGEEVSFFGRPAATSAALARFARATRAPVVAAFLVRTTGGFRMEITDPLPLRWTDHRGADLRLATQQLTQVLERVIAQHPEQWLWLHRRWKLPARGAAQGGQIPQHPAVVPTVMRALDDQRPT